MQNTKATLVAIGLGAALILSGCNQAQDAAKDVTNKGTEVAQKAKDEAGEMANKAKDEASDMSDKAKETVSEASEMASATFNDATEITSDTADSFKEKAMTAYTGMEEQFNGVKDSLDENVVKEMQAKFTSLKEKLDGLADKSGMELVSALNEIKVEGAALASEIKSVTGTKAEATPEATTTPEPTSTP